MTRLHEFTDKSLALPMQDAIAIRDFFINVRT